ncbi:MAG: hypothetical protein AAF915_18275 [Cyanobacteria bacterium P01_D01_bin.50]
MNILDLNHIEAVEGTEVIGGGKFKKGKGGVDFDVKTRKDVDIIFTEFVDVFKTFDILSKVEGTSALAEGDAEAIGKNSSAEVFTFTKTIDGVGSQASSTSISNS